MSKLNTNLLATIIALLVFFFLGRLIFLSGTQVEIEQAKSQLEHNQQNHTALEAELAKLKQTVKAETIPNRSNKLLLPGEETSILRFILDNSGNSFRLNSFELLESYRVKSGVEEESTGTQFAAVSEELPQLDDQGMPVGVAVESDEEWPGVEVIPVKMTFTTTFRTFGGLLAEAGQKLPMNAVRSMDLLLRNTGTVKGTLVLTFPVAEHQKK